VVLTRFCHQAWRPVTVGRALRPLRGAAPGRVLEWGEGVNLQLRSTSTILGIIAATLVAGGLAACGTPSTSAHPVAAGPASAADVPVRVQPNAAGWSGMVQP
jgi:hypothetical protein